MLTYYCPGLYELVLYTFKKFFYNIYQYYMVKDNCIVTRAGNEINTNLLR